MLKTYITIRENLLNTVREEEGSEVAQAAGVAILAAAVIGAMLAFSGPLSGAVRTSFSNLVGSL